LRALWPAAVCGAEENLILLLQGIPRRLARVVVGTLGVGRRPVSHLFNSCFPGGEGGAESSFCRPITSSHQQPQTRALIRRHLGTITSGLASTNGAYTPLSFVARASSHTPVASSRAPDMQESRRARTICPTSCPMRVVLILGSYSTCFLRGGTSR
jgi:hypothetical protein